MPAVARTEGHDDVRDTDAAGAAGPGASPEPAAEAAGSASEVPEPAAEATEPVGPAPLGVERTPTDQAAVDTLLARLGDADHLPADGHLEVYEDVHRGLRDELTSLDAAARPGPTPTYDHRS
ncbi:hypothetical protein [Streptomyces solicamelliae]|uniref:hypothetical protein n=1 Tax=Streptomyces solicamelliae TaxID=3231716 RepID=UPI003877EEB1